MTEYVVITKEAYDRAKMLLRLVTVGQVVAAGDAAISASGVNPWAMNEGLAEKDSPISTHWFDVVEDVYAVVAEYADPERNE